MKRYQIKNISDNAIKSALRTIIESGGKVYIDNSFKIEGVKGSFTLQDGVLTITIHYKPWHVSWNTIKEYLREFFS